MSTEQHQQELGLRENDHVKRIEEYTFEPIRGFPMLQWAGKRPFTSTQYYPAQHKETYGLEANEWRNKIYWGDNLQVMSHLLKEYRSKVKLVYIDPPFDSKADYKRRIMLKSQDISNDFSVFEEKQYSDIWTNDEYLHFMYERLILLKELLAEDGTIYLHCDFHKAHHLRCIMDEIFGPDNFVNQVTWKRSHAHGDTGQGAKHFGPVTETILIYGKTKDVVWHPQYEPYSDEIIKRDYKYIDERTGEYCGLSAPLSKFDRIWVNSLLDRIWVNLEKWSISQKSQFAWLSDTKPFDAERLGHQRIEVG